ncbi:MAG: PQQ-binding-like beta-propeller repeat protein [Bryobacteraceae bacterium]|nr:PQQ-binding-like beta-propeller repeat protein [Bryobacteraceae bacterium]
MAGILLSLMLLGLAGPAWSEAPRNWPQFRGPNGSGVDSATGYPVEFSPQKNVAWKQAIPFGQSSPVVVDGLVYLTASDGAKRVTLCLDAATGRVLWRREIEIARPEKLYRSNDPASPTPAADGHGVVVFFPEFGLAAYTPSGETLWTLPLGPFQNFYGMAASPILSGDQVILVCDQQSGSFVLSLDRKTGSQRWKTMRPGATIGWSTPVIFRPTGGPEQVAVLGTSRLDSYYAATGELRWWMPIGSMGALGTPLASGDTLFISTQGAMEPYIPAFESVLGKYDKDKDGQLSEAELSADKDLALHFGWIDADGDGLASAQEWEEARNWGIGEYGAVAVRPGNAEGRLPPEAVLWRFKRNLPYVPAPLLYRDVLYLVRDGGIVTALNPQDGTRYRQGRSRGALGVYYASPVAADGKVFAASTEGKISVLRAAKQWEVLAVNDLGEEIHATPALTEGRIYVRTRDSLYCFAEPTARD